MQPQDSAFLSTELELRPEWIDYNGHLNMAYYNVLFDLGADQAFEIMGFGADYAKTRNHTTYSAEFHVRYLREIHLGDRVRLGFQLLDVDRNKFHFCQWMFHQDGWLAATGEGLGLHIDMAGPRVAPFPGDVAVLVDAMAKDHARYETPEFVGKPIGIRR